MKWAPAKYRSAPRGQRADAHGWQPCAVQLPITQIDNAAFVMLDADGTVLGGILGTVYLFPYTDADKALTDWKAVIEWAQREIDREAASR